MKFFLSTFFLFTLASCGKNSDYLYKNTMAESVAYSETHSVVGDGGKVDIIMVLDNSGSMDTIQKNVILHMNEFMQEFIKNKSLDWKIGLLSTSWDEQPYLGFATPFDSTDPDPVKTFVTAANRLGTMGDGHERNFDPIMKYLNAFPNFLRPQAHLITIMISDEIEQSDVKGVDFVADMIRRKNNNPKMYTAFGAFNVTDFGCTYGTVFDYKGTEFQIAISATGGKAYSTCAPDFGLKMASMGQDIVSAVASPVILLKRRPVTKSLVVTYKGKYLPGGTKENNGMWLYDPEVNGIRFHDLDFVDFSVRDVLVTFDIDS